MEREQLKSTIIDLIEKSLLGSVATLDGDKPRVRYMIIRHDGDLKLGAATYSKSRKIDQINKNENVHITMGGDAKNWELPYVNIQATAKVLTDQETKNKYWEDKMNNYFKGPEDPNYAIIEFYPQLIEYMTPGAIMPEVYAV